MSKKKKSVKTAGTSSAGTTSATAATTTASSAPSPVEHQGTAATASATAATAPATTATAPAIAAAAETTTTGSQPLNNPCPVATSDSQTSTASSRASTPSQDPDRMEVEETGLQQLSLLERGQVTMAQAQVEQGSIQRAPKRTLAQVYKIDLDEVDEEYPLEKRICPYVNKSLHRLSGVVIRILNQDIPQVPAEIGLMRLSVSRAENIPAILYREKGKLKSWAISQVRGALHESGHNNFDDKRFTVEEFTCRYTVSSLSDYGRLVLGKDEPGLWVLHAPTLVQPVVAERFPDGSAETFHLLKVYVNLVKPEFRIRQIPEGWIPKAVSDTEVEKRKYPNKFKHENRYYDKRPRSDEYKKEVTAVATEAAVAACKKTIGPGFPNLPATQNIAGMVQWPENDIPKISKKL